MCRSRPRFAGAAECGKLRFQRRADCIETAFYGSSGSRAAGDFVRCTRSGREKAFNRLRRLFEDAGARFLDRDEARLARWAYLRPMDEWVQATLATISRSDFGAHITRGSYRLAITRCRSFSLSLKVSLATASMTCMRYIEESGATPRSFEFAAS